MPTSEENRAQAQKFLLGGAVILQTVLTGLGVSNGGFDAMVINHFALLLIGLILVLGAVAVGAVLTTVTPSATFPSPRIMLISRIAIVCLFVGIGITAYTALIAPAVAKAPDIDLALSEDTPGKRVLTAEIKAGGIPEGDHYWIEIDAREYNKREASYIPLGTPLYKSQIGADGNGNIDSKITVPLPPGAYQAVSTEAWYGNHPGPCGSLSIAGGARNPAEPKTPESEFLKENGRPGCIVVRIPRA